MRQLTAGVSIGNSKKASTEGTLACFARLRGTTTKVLLSVSHVIFDAGAGPPISIGSPNAGSCRSCCAKNLVADAHFNGRFGNIAVGGSTTFLDCAVAQLRADVTGIDQIPTLRGKARDGSDAGGFLKGTHAAVKGEPVTIASQRLTMTGIVKEVGVDVPVSKTDEQKNQILILVDAQFKESIVEGTGDSGAAVINQFNEVIGLMHSRGSSAPGGAINELSDLIIACPIQQVMDGLGIDIPPATPASPSHAAELEEVPQAEEYQAELTDPELLRFQDLVLQSPTGAAIHEAAFRHGHEVVRLVHHCRPVTVAWHRSQGPAWAAHFLNSARDPGYRVPEDVKGVTQEMLLRRMAAELSNHGSEALRRDIAERGPMVIALAGVQDIAAALDRIGVPAGARRE